MEENKLERWQRNLDNLSKNSFKAGCGLILFIGLVVLIVFLVIVVIGIIDTTL